MIECVVRQSFIRRDPNPLCGVYSLTEYGDIEHVGFPFQVQTVTGRRYLNAEHIFN
jgi:hypothetical protein